jgi:hypothetical protein
MDNETKDIIEEISQEAFEYGDLQVICKKCGATQTLDKSIKNGIQITLLTNPNSFLFLKCDKCDSGMELRFVKGEAPVEEPQANVEEPQTNMEKVEEQNEVIQEEDNQTESV